MNKPIRFFFTALAAIVLVMDAGSGWANEPVTSMLGWCNFVSGPVLIPSAGQMTDKPRLSDAFPETMIIGTPWTDNCSDSAGMGGSIYGATFPAATDTTDYGCGPCTWIVHCRDNDPTNPCQSYSQECRGAGCTTHGDTCAPMNPATEQAQIDIINGMGYIIPWTDEFTPRPGPVPLCRVDFNSSNNIDTGISAAPDAVQCSYGWNLPRNAGIGRYLVNCVIDNPPDAPVGMRQQTITDSYGLMRQKWVPETTDAVIAGVNQLASQALAPDSSVNFLDLASKNALPNSYDSGYVTPTSSTETVAMYALLQAGGQPPVIVSHPSGESVATVATAALDPATTVNSEIAMGDIKDCYWSTGKADAPELLNYNNPAPEYDTAYDGAEVTAPPVWTLGPNGNCKP